MIPESIRILIVDDEPFFRHALATYFSDCKNFENIGEASNGIEAVEILATTSVDVVLCDIRMPIMDGVEFCQRVAEMHLPCKVIALTSFNDESALLAMLQAGAFGYLLKSTNRHNIIAAVHAAAQGGTTISPEAATFLKNFLTVPSHIAIKLPRHERNVLSLLHKGESTSSIATELAVSQTSVKKAVSRLLQRFKASSRMELVAVTRNQIDSTSELNS